MQRIKSESDIQRRDFVKVVLASVGTLIGSILGLPIIGYLVSPATRQETNEAWVPLGSLENYPPGIPTLFSFTRSKLNGWEKTVTSYGVYVLRNPVDEVKVFSNICTHLGCRVKWHVDIQEYVSPCHDGHFDIHGMVTKGPPPPPPGSV